MLTLNTSFRSITAAILAACASLPASSAPAARLAHLMNGGFERMSNDPNGKAAAAGWSPYDTGYSPDSAVAHGGASSIRCVNPSPTAVSGAFCAQSLNQTRAAPVVVTGWSKAVGVEGEANSDYSIYVDLTYTDGTALWGQAAAFETGTHGWQRRRLMIMPSKPLRSMNVYALFRSHAGTAWFDDFDAHQVPNTGIFDGQEIAPISLKKGRKSGWFIRDVTANAAALPLSPGRKAADVLLESTRDSAQGRIREASLRNTAARPKCVTVYYAERFDAPNATWWDDVRNRRPASADGEYGNLEPSTAGVNGHISLYPFGCVTARGKGMALGVPPSQQPRVARIVYNARAGIMFVAYDIALSAHGDAAGHDAVTLAAARFDVDPAWGFRDAAARFYALFPDAYSRRATKEGIWMPFTAPAKIAQAGDFHFAYHEGDNSVATDRANGILSFRYVEPMSYWMPMPKNVARTYGNAVAMVTAEAARPIKDPTATAYQGDLVRQSQAVLSSGSQDARGRYNVTFRDAPWCDGAVWVLNPNPRMPHALDKWTKARLNDLGKPIPGRQNQPDGEFLDSIEMSAGVLDYRPESLLHSRAVATFTPDTFVPVLPTWFSVYESAAALSQDLHRHGKLLMANATPWGFTAFGPLLDVMGTETDMFSDGKWVGEADDRFNLRRTLCYHKPYLLLLNTDFSKLDYDKMGLYFQRCMFYGIFPSMFSANAADHAYWEDPKLYNRDRPLFKKYLPVISLLSSAGWEPVTHARSSQEPVWLERYGRNYLTVLNSADAPRTVSISLDPAWMASGKRLTVKDAITGESVTAIAAKDATSVKLTLAPSETRVLRIMQ